MREAHGEQRALAGIAYSPHLEVPTMRSIADFFHRPAFSRVNKDRTPEDNPSRASGPVAVSPSSPLTEPPPSSFLEQISRETHSDLETPPDETPQFLVPEIAPQPTSPQQASQSTESAAGLSALSGSFQASQRIVKGGKEIVISSDGEDTDSISSLEDPLELFKPKSKQTKHEISTESKGAMRTDKAFRAKPSAPKYRNTIDSLVHDAVDDNEVEANVARVKAAFAQSQPNGDEATDAGPSKTTKARPGLHEDMLTSALGDGEGGVGLQRLLDAVRRTEALEQDRVWQFFTQNQKLPPIPGFPRDSFDPGTYMAVLREPETRERALQSGVIEFALARQYLPDKFVLWIFLSIPSEHRDELRNAYCRIFKHATAERVASVIRPSDIGDLFRRLGAKPQALDIFEPVVADPPHASRDTRLKDRSVFLTVLELLRGTAHLFADDSRERILCLLLRLTIDTSLTADAMICSELERAIDATLQSVPEASAAEMMHRVCAKIYETVSDTHFQSRILRHILPTSSWIALLRCRLAVAFLIQDPSPLTEPPEEVLDLKRLTVALICDERFQVKLYKGKGDYDYGQLSAMTMLLNVAIDSSLLHLKYNDPESEKYFNAAIDKLAMQIKKIFSSIEDSGASHLKRMLAKEALEALHYRIVYSVRSRPPPKKTLFKTYAKENGHIQAFFGAKLVKHNEGTETPEAVADAEMSDSTAMKLGGNTKMPFREHDSAS